MCNAYNLRHREAAILDIARAMQRPVSDLPEFRPGPDRPSRSRADPAPRGRRPADLALGAVEPDPARGQGTAGLPAHNA